MKNSNKSEEQEPFMRNPSPGSWRRIASSQHNKHLSQGISQHESTKAFPDSLLEPLSEEIRLRNKATQRAAESVLYSAIGEPFFRGTGFILYKGDCVELLERLSGTELRIDLTVTSPPYNIGKEYESKLTVDDYINWCSKWIEGVYSITRPFGAFWLNVGYLEVPTKGLCVPIPYLLWDKSPFYFLQEIVWKYGAGVSAKRRLSPRNEKWLFYVNDPSSYTFNLDDIRDPNVKYPNQVKNGKYRCNPLGKNPSDVWEFAKVTTGRDRSSEERTGHPAQFPLKVVERVVRVSSNVGDIVLDPFAGSSSAGIAAAGLGRIFVGFEMRQDYCEVAVERYEELNKFRETARLQAALF